MLDPAAWVEAGAAARPDAVFMTAPDGYSCSYAALRERSGRFAAALRQLGVGPGDRVAVQADKSPDAVLLYIACLRMGAVFVPINTANTLPEVAYFLSDSQARVAVVRTADRAGLEAIAAQAGVGDLVTLGSNGDGTLAELARGMEPWAADFANQAALAPTAVAAIVYTSGTTGRSKGAMLTRANLSTNAAALVEAWRFGCDDVLLHALPLFHVHGLFAAINTVLASGASLILLPRFDVAMVLAHLRQASVYMGVPTHYTRLLQSADLNPGLAAQIRLFVSGSAPLRADTHREFFARTGHTILERYGMTETLMNTSNPYDGPRVPGSVGPALPGISIRVADPAGGEPGTPDAVGQLEIRGPNVFAGYWRDPGKTRGEFTADAWFKTGDLGRIDADGYVYIVGRAKDLVISGGYNVYPKEVEMELDAVQGVLESAVFGVAHPDFGEGVTAAVVRKPGAELSETAIIQAIHGRLAGYKIPKRVLLVDELPRNTMGKVQKNVLRQTYAKLYVGTTMSEIQQ